MKKILSFLGTILGIFLIFVYFDKGRINYVSIGDELMIGKTLSYQKGYGYNDFIYDYLNNLDRISSFNTSFYNVSISGLTKDIKNNRTIRDGNNEYFFKKVLRESDVLVISVGMEEFSENYNKYDMSSNYLYFNKMYLDIENLIKEIVKYAKGMIIFLGYYNPSDFYDGKTDEFFCNMDIKLNRLMMNNDVSYIDLYELVKENAYKEKQSIYLNKNGYEKISKIIEFYLN